MTTFVRPFQPADREALLQIGAETAFFGAPIEKYMEDRRIFMDAFYAYYTDFEPEHAWVAVAEDQVAGFLTGCTDTRRHDSIMQSKILPAVIGKFLRGRYHSGQKTGRYILAALIAALRREFPTVDLRQYPAHLHINLLPEARGKGLGRALMQSYLSQLQELSVPGVHLHTTSLNEIACRLYVACGFRLLSARPTRMYAQLVESPIENRCYGQKLN